MSALPERRGALVLVATPIGNLGDLSQRAKEVLASADLLCCEDTRRTRQLLSAFGLPASPRRLWALHEHNEQRQLDAVLDLVAQGKIVALVSDAGMPAISDPGALLVAAAHDRHLAVTVVPGASSVLGALVVSGLDTRRFCVEGFLPRKGRARTALLQSLSTEQRTMVILEAPGRVDATLRELAVVLGVDRPATLVRELTKLHEQVLRSTLGALADAAGVEMRGEVVLVVAGAAAEVAVLDDVDLDEAITAELEAGSRVRDVAVQLAERFGLDRHEVYDRCVELQRTVVPPRG